MISEQVLAALRHKYPLPEWAGFAELRDGTGMAALRSVDFWAMNCYPSKGFLTVAVEVKVSRSDFIRELNNPHKRESAEKLARETYFAAPVGMLKSQECPDGWGLIEVGEGGSARTKLRARQREAPTFPHAFLASLMRRLAEDDQKLRALRLQVDKANLAARDVEAYLFEREKEHFERRRKDWESQFRREAIESVMGEGYSKVLALVQKEFGFYPSKSPSQCIVELIERATSETLNRIGTQEVRDGLRDGLRTLKKLSELLGEEAKS